MAALKILMVSETVPAPQLGGLAKHAVTLANTLVAQGHQVTLMGRRGTQDVASMKELGFDGPFLGALDFVPGWKEGALGCFNPLKRPYFARKFARTIVANAHGFDVVHYHGNLPLVAAYIPHHINFVQTRHDQGAECLIHVRFRRNEVCLDTSPRACAGCATTQPNLLQTWVSAQAVKTFRTVSAQALSQHKTIFVSEAIRQNARRVLPEAAFAKSHVVHNFVDLHVVQQLTAGTSPQTNGLWNVFIASRLDDAKGVGQFLEAWQSRAPGQHRASITIAGDGPLRNDMVRAYEGPAICFLGHQTYAATLQSIARSNVVVVPSHCEESFSTTVLEALAIGRRCFALSRGGTPEQLAYQRWPGQLTLYPDINALVDDLLALTQTKVGEDHAATPHSLQPSNPDVRAQLPHLLKIYGA